MVKDTRNSSQKEQDNKFSVLLSLTIITFILILVMVVQ